VGLLWQGIRNKFIFRFNFFKVIVAPVSLLAFILVLEPFIGKEFPLETHIAYMVAATIVLLFLYRREIRPLINSES
jgi:hypothetical protein